MRKITHFGDVPTGFGSYVAEARSCGWPFRDGEYKEANQCAARP
jgi:hypothetical protein